MSKQESTEETAVILHEETTTAVSQNLVSFRMAKSNGIAYDKDVLEQIITADCLDFDVKGDYWSPTRPGEQKRMIFQQIKTEQVPDIFGTDKESMVEREAAYFVEVYLEDGEVKQRMIRTMATVLIAYLKKNNVPKHAAMTVEYKGKMKGRQFSFDDFSIKLLIQK